MESGVFLSGPVPGVRGGRKVPPSLCLSSFALSRPRRQRHQRESPLSRRVSTGDERTGPSWHFRFSRRLLNRREGREGWFGGGAGGGLPTSAASAMRSSRRYALCPPPPLLRSVASGRGYPRRGRPSGASPSRKHPELPRVSLAGGAGRGGMLPPSSPPPPHHHPPAQRALGRRRGMSTVARRGPCRDGMRCDAMRCGGKAAHCTEGIASSRPSGGELQPQPPRLFFFFRREPGPACPASVRLRLSPPPAPPPPKGAAGRMGGHAGVPVRCPALHPLRRGSRAGAWPHDNGTRRRYKYPPASIFGLAGSQRGGREGVSQK